MKYLFTILLFILIINFSISFADIINVPADVDSIQGGIDLANPGDTVLVQPGTYYENINFNGKNVVVGSWTLTTADTSYVSQTVIDGNSNGSVVKFGSGEDSIALLCGFTITNGSGLWYVDGGGGINVNNSSPTLEFLKITYNHAAEGAGICLYNSNLKISHATVTSNITLGLMESGGVGGGILIANSNPVFTNVSITNNISQAGAGIYCVDSNPTLIDVTVKNNSATIRGMGGASGGGIIFENSNPDLKNVVVKDNVSDYVGGILFNNSSGNLSNVTIKENSATYGGGLCIYGGPVPVFDSVDRCNIYLNTASFGRDLYVKHPIANTIYVDTFTVANPTDYFVYLANNCTLDILNAKVEQVNSDLFVNPVGNDNNSGLSSAEPLRTISYALIKIMADSLNPRIVYLADGEYSPRQTGENYPLNMRDLVSLSGESESGVILNADNQNRVIEFINDKGITIENITVIGGAGIYDGGGIFCQNSNPEIFNVTLTKNAGRGMTIENISESGEITAPKLSDVDITGNSAWGIYCYHSSPVLTNVNISKNGGGGIYIEGTRSLPDLVNVAITDNGGDGIECYRSNPILDHVYIARNSKAGIASADCNLELINVTITKNTGQGIYLDWSKLTMLNTILWDNSPLNLTLAYAPRDTVYIFYSNIQDTLWPGVGNLKNDPIFVDAANGDYNLQPGSPCIDAGIQDTMIFYNDGQDTLFVPLMDYIGSAPDMGAYEFDLSTGITEKRELPTQYTLFQNYPNPFNPKTVICYQMPVSSEVELSIYNTLGQKVATLVNFKQAAGTYNVEWDASGFATGIYIYQLKAKGKRQKTLFTKKLVLLK
jgi:hypothetical protein